MDKGFTSQRKNLLFGLSLIFALSFFLYPSYSASAIGSWSSSSDTTYTSLTYDVYGGCLQAGYEIMGPNLNGSSVKSIRLGANSVSSTTSKSDLYNCGYRMTNSHMNYLEHSAAVKRVLTNNNGTITDTFNSTGGTNNMITNQNANYDSYDFDVYNQVEALKFKFASGTTVPFVLPIEPDKPDGSDSWYQGYAFYLLSFDVPNSAVYMGTQFGIGSTSSLVITSGSNRSFEEVREEMNDYILTWCGDINSYERGFPSELTSLSIPTTDGYYKCFVGGTVPLGQVENAVKFYQNNTIVLEAKNNDDYSKSYYTTTDGKYLTRYGYPWHGVFSTPSYKVMGSRSADPLNFTNPRFDIVWCSTGQECDDFYSKAQALMTDTFSSVGSVNTSGDYSSTVQEEIDYNNQKAQEAQNSWAGLNVGFNVPWIFSGWFDLFVDNECVDIDQISSWLHSEEKRICSPWTGTNVRTVLTPVITAISTMLLFGFIVRWLKHGNSTEVE